MQYSHTQTLAYAIAVNFAEDQTERARTTRPTGALCSDGGDDDALDLVRVCVCVCVCSPSAKNAMYFYAQLDML